MNKLKTNKELKAFLILALFIVFVIKGVIFLDPDFGWRLRTGNIIFRTGLPRTDIYSYTMPSFPWVDHAWMTDVLIKATYSVSGRPGLALVFSLLAFSALLITVFGQKHSKNWLNFWWRLKLEQQDLWYFGLPSLLLAVASLFPFFGVRAQVVTWFFFALFLKLIFNERLWKRFGFLVPILFWVWANFHGGFVAGLGVFWAVYLIRLLFSKKAEKTDLGILLISTLLTFVNPYGWGVYREVWSSVADSSLRFEIMEWQPAFLSFDIPSLILLAISTTFVTKYRKKFALERVVVFYGILFEGVASIRHFPLFVLTALPLTVEAINFFYKENKNNKLSQKRFVDLYSYLWIISFLVFLTQMVSSYKEAIVLSEEVFYPGRAISYLQQNMPDNEIFSDYAWGGYLIWKLPQKKVFIDGRMPSWSWIDNPPNESENIMKEYVKLIKGKTDYKPIFQKYNISTVLWSTKKPETFFDHLERVFGNNIGFLYKLLNIDRTRFSFPDELEKDGWKEIYRDDVSVIYTKPQNDSVIQ